MSGWVDDYEESTAAGWPDPVNDEPAQPQNPDHPSSSSGGRSVQDTPEVVAARNRFLEAKREAASASGCAGRAADALADAEGAVRVAEAKVDDYDNDEKTKPWQRTAAAEGLAKSQRACERAASELQQREAAQQTAQAEAHAAAASLTAAITAAAYAAAQSKEASNVDEEAGPYYGSVNEFVRELLRHTYSRRVDGRAQTRVWAARWWEYDEALIRLEALWRSWEHLRLEPDTGMSVWLRDHADHHMRVLFDPDGPFAGAEGPENECRRGQPLPYAAPPEGMFPDVRAAQDASAHM